MSKLDVEKIRKDFPILETKVNGKKLVYLDSAATMLKPKVVADKMWKHYAMEASNVHRGVHFLSEQATTKYELSREKVKSFINAPTTDEIVFTSGTTASINLVAKSFGREFIKEDDEVIITYIEHHSNIVPWQMLCEENGCSLKVVPVNDAGEIDLEHFKSLLTERTKLVSVVWASNSIGTVNPVKEMIRLAHEKNIRVLIDGAQAVAHFDVDVQDLDCDFFALSAHKLLGPTGVGVLYAKRELLDEMPPFLGGGDMIKTVSFEGTTFAESPSKFEAGTPHIAGAIGLGEGIDYILSIGLDKIRSYEQELLLYATEKLSAVEGLRIVGTAKDKAAIISFVIDGIHPHDMGTILNSDGIAVRTGHHCCQPAMERFEVPGTVRASFAFYNTMDEIDLLVAGIKKAQEIFS